MEILAFIVIAGAVLLFYAITGLSVAAVMGDLDESGLWGNRVINYVADMEYGFTLIMWLWPFAIVTYVCGNILFIISLPILIAYELFRK